MVPTALGVCCILQCYCCQNPLWGRKKSLCPYRWGAKLLGRQLHWKSEKQCWPEVHILLESLAGPQVNRDRQGSICPQCPYLAVAMCPSHGAVSTRLLPACQVLCTRPKKLAIILYYSCRLSLEILFSCSILQWINFQAAGKLLPVIGDKKSPRDTLPMNLLTTQRGRCMTLSSQGKERAATSRAEGRPRTLSVLPILTMSSPSEAMLQLGSPRCQPKPHPAQPSSSSTEVPKWRLGISLFLVLLFL